MNASEVREAFALLRRRETLVEAEGSVTSLVNWSGAVRIAGSTSGSLGVGRDISVDMSRGAIQRLMREEIDSVDRMLKSLGVEP